MRLLPLLTLLTSLILPTTLAAQQAPQAPAPDAQPAKTRPYTFTLQLDPLTTALGYLHLQLEHAPTPHLSFYLSPHLRLFDSVLSDVREDYTGIGAELGLRYFFRPSAPAGLWIGPRGVLARLTTPEREGGVLGGYVSALIGYTYIFSTGFLLSGGAGVQYLHYQVDGLGPRGVFPALHTTFGVAF